MEFGAVLAAYGGRGDEEVGDVARTRAALTGDAWSRSAALHVTGSALIVHPQTRRVLLRWHVRQNAWLQVGGHADPGEADPLVTALREGAEETGLKDLAPFSPDILHVVIVPVPANAHEPAHQHADVRYLLVTESPEAARPEKPDAPLRWLSLPEAQAATSEANLRETLSRAAALLDRGPG